MNDRDFIRAQVIELDRLIELAGDHPLMGPNLRSRKAAFEAQLGNATTIEYYKGVAVRGET